MRVAPVRGNPLLDAYLAGEPAARALYSGHPGEAAAWQEKLAEVRSRFGRAEREQAAAALTATSPHAAARLRRFVEEGGAMVTTGQQAGLFTGPLYTVLKALSALRLAAALEAQLGVLVLPVFWVASEDHDFAEVNHAYALDGGGALRRLQVSAGAALPLPMSEMPLGDEVGTILDDFAHMTVTESFTVDDIKSILQAYRPGETVAGAFRNTLATLFAGHDLLLADAADPALKRASAPLLLAELRDAAAHEALVEARGELLRAAGFTPQVTVLEGATNLFWHGPAGRERLYRDGDGFVAREARRRLTLAQLREGLDADPRSLSPNVLLRPVVESAVFPTLAYLGGPAETAYFAQIQPLFQAAGIRPPLAVPRFGATVVPAEAAEAQQRLGVSDAELAAPEHELWDGVARRAIPAENWRALDALRRELIERFAALMEAAARVDPNLDAAVGARRNRALLEVARSERTLVRHFKQRNPQLRNTLLLARNHLRPLGAGQERVLTIFQYLGREPALLERLGAAMEVQLPPLGAGAAAGERGPQPAASGT